MFLWSLPNIVGRLDRPLCEIYIFVNPSSMFFRPRPELFSCATPLRLDISQESSSPGCSLPSRGQPGTSTRPAVLMPPRLPALPAPRSLLAARQEPRRAPPPCCLPHPPDSPAASSLLAASQLSHRALPPRCLTQCPLRPAALGLLAASRESHRALPPRCDLRRPSLPESRSPLAAGQKLAAPHPISLMPPAAASSPVFPRSSGRLPGFSTAPPALMPSALPGTSSSPPSRVSRTGRVHFITG